MAFKLTLARVAEKGALAFRSHSLLGQNGRNAGDPVALYKAGGRVSLIGAALPSRIIDWLDNEGLSGWNLRKLVAAGHLEIEPDDRQAIFALEALDVARRDHVRRATGHGPALELALAAFVLEKEAV